MRNAAASVRQRLLNLSREQGRPFQEVLQFYVMERFLYRLSQSGEAERFILKGALMLQVWEAPQSRPTMDIDMLGHADNDPNKQLERIRSVLRTETVDDGLIFDSNGLQAETITKDANYQGIRIRGQAHLDGARVSLQIDIGFGDAIVPEPRRMSYPALLDFPAPVLLCYSRESTIAEKFQAMVALGPLNSRMKDFYDIWLLSRQFEFELDTLAEAIRTTFGRRDTRLPSQPIFSEGFASDKKQQWRAFLRRLGDDVPVERDFASVLAGLEDFLGKVVAVSSERDGQWIWRAGGAWQRRDTDV
ncbi:nucleotidyl transferase AbiEii/AbiGii toxin family protein [Gammaproteobacteria bacterium AB-CW1]|uniref:Nucleotidyl transferase AbiEii/AbiGii toxin family protein n=1 Tax=Natronospira elongata TaxID=3110268 RepID=A0AAP6JGG7_9GAMM|nr:nucleotidyl transferase AbiEii/AbiGii toxin family protein [Gammaproteobacteria bacterium AB-CW1]